MYVNLGFVVSGTGGAALKLIFAASLNTGLKVEVISIVLFLVVSCENAPIAQKQIDAAAKILFEICLFIV